MELDDIKREWQHSDIFKKMIKDSVIKEMLVNQNKGALNKISRNEKQALYIIPACVVFIIFLSLPVITNGGFGAVWALLFIPIGGFLWWWSYYLCNYLAKIDMAWMNVSEVSQHILQYRTYLNWHSAGASIFYPVYTGLWIYFHVKATMPPGEELGSALIISFFIIVLTGFVVMHIAIWKRFYSHVSDIQKNLKELKEFRDDEELIIV